MAKNITLSSANNIGVNNNTYQYNFKQGGIEFDDDSYLSCNQIIVPNSIVNVAPEYNNTQFAYTVSGNGYVGGTSNNPIAFTLNSDVANSNSLSLNITNGFLWNGYALIFTGLTTTSPIYITDIGIADVSSATATVVINQNITLTAGATGTAYIVGNQMIIQTTSGCPKINMWLDRLRCCNQGGFLTMQGTYNYITAVSTQNGSNTNNIYLTTWYNAFPYDAQFSYFQLTTQTLFTYTITLPTGYYDVPAINSAIQQELYNNGHFIFNKYPVNGVSPTGYTNQGIIYPTKIETDYTRYSTKITTTFFPSLTDLQTTYGASAYVNTNYVINGSFDDYTIPILNYNVNVVNLAGWLPTTTNGGQIFIQNGTALLNGVSFSPPTASYTQFVYLISNTVSSSTATITQSSSAYFPAGNYTLYYWARKSNTGAGDVLSITLDTTYTNSPSGSVWTRYSQAFTSTGQNITVAFSYTTSNPTQPIAVLLTGITIVNNNSLQQTIAWKGGYVGGSATINFNAYQVPNQGYIINGSNQLNYTVNKNPYSLGYMILGVYNNQAFQNGTYSPYPYGVYLSPYYGIVIRCNLLENPMNRNTDIIDAFPILYAYGSNNLYSGDPNNDIKIKKGKYSSLVITLCDVNGNPIKLLDNNVLLTFIIKKKYNHYITGFRGY